VSGNAEPVFGKWREQDDDQERDNKDAR
jgi:hypothetical protein